MPQFYYVVRDKKGVKVTGSEEAPNEEELIARLQAKEFIVINVLPEIKDGLKGISTQAKNQGYFQPRHYRITNNDITLFCRQLAVLLGAGVPLLRSLEIISNQVSSRKLRLVIKDLQKNMEHGLSLHEAMAKHHKVFSELWVNLVESGEASGNLAVILNRLAGYLEREAAFRTKIISALIYPAILVVAGLGALLFLTIKIIPTFTQLFQGFNITLPLITRILIAVSSIVRRYIIFIIMIPVAVFWLLRKYLQTKDGRMRYEKLQIRLPIFGEFFRVLITERFSSDMATLLESGVPILYSLEITERSVANLVMAEVIRQVKEDVRQGKTLSRPLEKSGFFEPMVVQMVSIGEEIGELPQMFKKVNTFYQEYVETFINRFTSLFEPIMLVFMGVVIGVMVIGLFLPIFQISQLGGAGQQ